MRKMLPLSTRHRAHPSSQSPRLALAAWLALLVPVAVSAQTVALVPESLGSVPSASIGDGIYWQQLRIILGHDDAASSQAILVELPEGVTVRDADEDGALFDEIRVVYRAAGPELPRFRAATMTSTTRIAITNQERAAAGGELYLQFPVDISSTAATASYRSVSFSDPREQDLAGAQLPSLTFVSPAAFTTAGSMALVSFAAPLAAGIDTSTTAKGTVFPTAAEVLLGELPDLVFDSGLGVPNNRAGLGDGDDANDTVYRFFLATRSDLTSVDADIAAEVLRVDSALYSEREGAAGDPVQLLTRDLPAGRYWLYVTADVTGGVPLGRSRALNIRHEPVFERLGPSGEDPVTFDTGGLYDVAGAPNGAGPRRFVLDLEVVDHDDDAIIHLFYSGNPNLGDDDATVMGETVVLAGATAITINAGLPEATVRFDWNTTGPPTVAAGDYYIYAVAVAGGEHTVARTTAQILVRHAPFLRLDALQDDGREAHVVSGGPSPQRFVSLTWGRSGTGGDADVDDDARIDLYYSSRDDFALPTGSAAIAAAALDTADDTQPIVLGLSEDVDSRADNRFVWDLWSLEGTAAVPDSGRSYRVYGVIADSSHERLVQMSGGRANDGGARIRFSHPPTIRPVHPVAELNIDGGNTARVSWEDLDLDDDARIRIVLSAEDHGEISDYDQVTAGLAFVANSEAGRAQPEVDPEYDISEDSDVDYFDVGTEHLQQSLNADSPPQPGIYEVYLAIEEGDRFDGDTRAWRSRGRLKIVNPGAAPEVAPFRLQPEAFTIGTGAGVQPMQLLVNAAGDTVDMAVVSLRLDATRFAVVDQDTVTPEVQPFYVASGFSASKLVTNTATNEEGSLFLSLEYFDPGPSGIARLDGSRALVGFDLQALTGDGDEAIQLIADAEAGRPSRLELDGAPVHTPGTADLATAFLVAGRASLGGHVVLEGRGEMTAVVDVALRRPGDYADLDDPLFAATNDEDDVTPGIQVSLDTDGDFTLLEVPTGRFDLHLRMAGYLEGRAAGLETYAGAVLADVRPTTTGAAGDSLLLGGDVAGYTDVDGQSLPDNEITLADWDFVASLFGRQLAAEEDSVRADITGDGRVNIRDLSLVGANYRARGPRPVYRPVATVSGDVPLALALQGGAAALAGDTVQVALVASRGPAGVHALEVDLHLDPAGWRWLASAGPAGALATHRLHAWGDRLATASLGGTGLPTTQPLAQWSLVALQDGAPQPSLRHALALDRGHRRVHVELPGAVPTLVETAMALPQRFGLRPNYPNPFNPATVIEFQVPATITSAAVRLEVYDALGQRLRVLYHGTAEAGLHRIAWDGRDAAGRAVASGVYFSRLSAAGITAVRPMLLLR